MLGNADSPLEKFKSGVNQQPLETLEPIIEVTRQKWRNERGLNASLKRRQSLPTHYKQVTRSQGSWDGA